MLQADRKGKEMNGAIILRVFSWQFKTHVKEDQATAVIICSHAPVDSLKLAGVTSALVMIFTANEEATR